MELGINRTSFGQGYTTPTLFIERRSIPESPAIELAGDLSKTGTEIAAAFAMTTLGHCLSSGITRSNLIVIGVAGSIALALGGIAAFTDASKGGFKDFALMALGGFLGGMISGPFVQGIANPLIAGAIMHAGMSIGNTISASFYGRERAVETFKHSFFTEEGLVWGVVEMSTFHIFKGKLHRLLEGRGVHHSLEWFAGTYSALFCTEGLKTVSETGSFDSGVFRRALTRTYQLSCFDLGVGVFQGAMRVAPQLLSDPQFVRTAAAGAAAVGVACVIGAPEVAGLAGFLPLAKVAVTLGTGSREPAPEITRALNHERPEIQMEVVDALLRSDNGDAQHAWAIKLALTRRLDVETEPRVVEHILNALIPYLCEDLNHPSPILRGTVLTYLEAAASLLPGRRQGILGVLEDRLLRETDRRVYEGIEDILESLLPPFRNRDEVSQHDRLRELALLFRDAYARKGAPKEAIVCESGMTCHSFERLLRGERPLSLETLLVFSRCLERELGARGLWRVLELHNPGLVRCCFFDRTRKVYVLDLPPGMKMDGILQTPAADLLWNQMKIYGMTPLEVARRAELSGFDVIRLLRGNKPKRINPEGIARLARELKLPASLLYLAVFKEIASFVPVEDSVTHRTLCEPNRGRLDYGEYRKCTHPSARTSGRVALAALFPALTEMERETIFCLTARGEGDRFNMKLADSRSVDEIASIDLRERLDEARWATLERYCEYLRRHEIDSDAFQRFASRRGLIPRKALLSRLSMALQLSEETLLIWFKPELAKKISIQHTALATSEPVPSGIPTVVGERLGRDLKDLNGLSPKEVERRFRTVLQLIMNRTPARLKDRFDAGLGISRALYQEVYGYQYGRRVLPMAAIPFIAGKTGLSEAQVYLLSRAQDIAPHADIDFATGSIAIDSKGFSREEILGLRRTIREALQVRKGALTVTALAEEAGMGYDTVWGVLRDPTGGRQNAARSKNVGHVGTILGRRGHYWFSLYAEELMSVGMTVNCVDLTPAPRPKTPPPTANCQEPVAA